MTASGLVPVPASVFHGQLRRCLRCWWKKYLPEHKVAGGHIHHAAVSFMVDHSSQLSMGIITILAMVMLGMQQVQVQTESLTDLQNSITVVTWEVQYSTLWPLPLLLVQCSEAVYRPDWICTSTCPPPPLTSPSFSLLW